MNLSFIIMKVPDIAGKGNILVYILIMAWVFYSFYRKFKKASPSQLPEGEENGEEPESKKIIDWMEEVVLGKETEEKSPVPSERTFQDEILEYQKSKGIEPKPFLDVEMNLYKGGEYEEDSIEKKEEETKKPVKDREEGYQEVHDFDLKQAVIYSAILKKPYN